MSELPRNRTFDIIGRRELLKHPTLQVVHDEIKGPLPGFNPTRATFDLPADNTLPNALARKAQQDAAKAGGAHIRWRARDNRKGESKVLHQSKPSGTNGLTGRHVLVVPKDHDGEHRPQLSTSWAAIGKGIWRMCTVFAWWDVSWWIAVLFSVGSAIFVASGLIYWLPLEDPSTAFGGEGLAGGLTSFIGATLFTIGGVLLIVEATNDNQTGCFGWALEHAFTHDSQSSDGENSSPDRKNTSQWVPVDCSHHHSKGIHHSGVSHMQHPSANRKWEWFPTWHELRHHYLHEIGFVGSFILSIGAIIFYVAGIMSLPWIYDNTPQGVLYGVYWMTYLVGGLFFVASSALYMLETQPNWYTPAPKVLGWWIGTWNMIGSVGWCVSASFGYCSASWCAYQSDLSLTWASIAFLIGSMLLWYESLDKFPVVVA